MKNKLTITAALVLSMVFGTIILPHTASAETNSNFTTVFNESCVVIGDNDIPLNVRARPNGKIIGKLAIGTDVWAVDLVTDKNGYNWTKIEFGKGYGWVATEFISCG